MKRFLALLTLLIVLACAGPFFIDGPDGKPLLTSQTLLPTDQSTVWRYWKNRLLLAGKMLLKQSREQLGVNRAEPEVFRWQDAQGVWHYGDTPPDSKQAEKVSLSAAEVITLNGSAEAGSDEDESD